MQTTNWWRSTSRWIIISGGHCPFRSPLPTLGMGFCFPKELRCFSLLRTSNRSLITCLPQFTERSCLPDRELELTAFAQFMTVELLYQGCAAVLPGQQVSLLTCRHNFLTRLSYPVIWGDLAQTSYSTLKNCDKSIVTDNNSHLVIGLFSSF